MEQQIGDVSLEDNVKSKYLKVSRMHYTQGGRKKCWDIAESHDSVACLIFHRHRKCFLLVKQFRPPVYLKHKRILDNEQMQFDPWQQNLAKQKEPSGFSFELCAGLCDKSGATPVKVCQEEIEEECGYAVDAPAVEFVNHYYQSVGTSAAVQYLFYAEVDETMKLDGKGGGLEAEGEQIELVELPLSELQQFMNDNSKVRTPAALFALMWWKAHKAQLHQ